MRNRVLETVRIEKDHALLRVRAMPKRLLMELSGRDGRSNRHRFELNGFSDIASLIYALNLASWNMLPRVVQWYDPVNRTFAAVFFRGEDYGDGNLKWRIYLRIGKERANNLNDVDDSQRTRVRLTREEVFRLILLGCMAIGVTPPFYPLVPQQAPEHPSQQEKRL